MIVRTTNVTRFAAALIALAIPSAGCSSSASAPLVAGEPSPDAPLPSGAAAPDAATASPDAATAAPPDAGAGTEVVYVATFLGGLLSFTIAPDSGALVPAEGSPYDPHGHLYALALEPLGRFLYAVDLDANQIVGFKTTPNSAALAPLEHFPLNTGTQPIAMAIDPKGRFAYVGTLDADASLFVYTIGPDDGSLSQAARAYRLGAEVSYIAPDPSGHFLYVQAANGIHVYSVNGTSGGLVEIDKSPFAFTLGGALTFHPGGKLLFNGDKGLRAFSVGADGGLSPVDGSPFTDDVGSDPMATDVAIDAAGRFVYVVDTFSGHLSSFAIDASQGKLTPVPHTPVDASPSPYSVAVDPAGRFVYVGNDDANEITAFAIAPETGELKPIDHPPFVATGLQPEMIIATARRF